MGHMEIKKMPTTWKCNVCANPCTLNVLVPSKVARPPVNCPYNEDVPKWRKEAVTEAYNKEKEGELNG